jgi:hypothetical protein
VLCVQFCALCVVYCVLCIGLVVARLDDGSWSAPSAIAVTGTYAHNRGRKGLCSTYCLLSFSALFFPSSFITVSFNFFHYIFIFIFMSIFVVIISVLSSTYIHLDICHVLNSQEWGGDSRQAES